MAKPTRFHGTLSASIWIHWSAWDRIDVTEAHILMRPWLREHVLIERDRVDFVEFEKDWRPLTWTSIVRFRFTDGTTAPTVFFPWHTRHFREALETLGWPTQDRRRTP